MDESGSLDKWHTSAFTPAVAVAVAAVPVEATEMLLNADPMGRESPSKGNRSEAAALGSSKSAEREMTRRSTSPAVCTCLLVVSCE